ncbi:MAG: hypothetical protein ABIR68_00770, partial [Ilumatobacteraceae bacterium]
IGKKKAERLVLELGDRLDDLPSSFGENLQLIRVFYTDYNALSADRRELVMGERRAYEQYSRELIEEGQHTGEFCPDLDSRVMNNAILTMVNTVYMWYTQGQEITVQQIAAEYGTFAINGLRCPADHDHPKATRPPQRPPQGGSSQ